MNDIKKELELIFNEIYPYLGDEDLNSSCNDEYELYFNDCIITDGLVSSNMSKAYNDRVEVITMVTSVRYASYVIIITIKEDKSYETSIYYDQDKMTQELFDSIKDKMFHLDIEQMHYYMYEWSGEHLMNPHIY